MGFVGGVPLSEEPGYFAEQEVVEGVQRKKQADAMPGDEETGSYEDEAHSGDVGVSGAAMESVVLEFGEHGVLADAIETSGRDQDDESDEGADGYEAVEQLYDLQEYAKATRPEDVLLPIEQRANSFDEVELGMPETAIREECKRCLRCDLEWLQVREMPEQPQPDRIATY